MDLVLLLWEINIFDGNFDFLATFDLVRFGSLLPLDLEMGVEGGIIRSCFGSVDW